MQNIMLTPLFNYLENIRPISREIKENFERELEIITVPKNQLLLKEGQASNYIYIVLKGLLRSYYIKDGIEVCSLFIDEQNISVAVNSFFTRKPSSEFIETMEPCIIARIHHDRLQEIYKDNLEFNFISRVITEQYLVRSEERLFLLRNNSAEERYTYLRDHYPQILQRVPLKYIATYLGMTFETLSRVRSKMSKNTRIGMATADRNIVIAPLLIKQKMPVNREKKAA